MTFPPPTEIGPMLLVECPFCDGRAVVDEAASTLVCEPCALVLPIDDQPTSLELAAAA